MRATVFKSHQRTFDCYLGGQKKIVQATAKGNLLKGEDTIAAVAKVIKEDETDDDSQENSPENEDLSV